MGTTQGSLETLLRPLGTSQGSLATLLGALAAFTRLQNQSQTAPRLQNRSPNEPLNRTDGPTDDAGTHRRTKIPSKTAFKFGSIFGVRLLVVLELFFGFKMPPKRLPERLPPPPPPPSPHSPPPAHPPPCPSPPTRAFRDASYREGTAECAERLNNLSRSPSPFLGLALEPNPEGFASSLAKNG